NRARAGGGIRTYPDSRFEQLSHSVSVHHDEDDIGRLPPDLQAPASATHGKHGRRAPTAVASTPAYQSAPSIVAAEDKGQFFFGRHNSYTDRAIQQIAGNAVVRRLHDFVDDKCRLLQPFRFLGLLG